MLLPGPVNWQPAIRVHETQERRLRPEARQRSLSDDREERCATRANNELAAVLDFLHREVVAHHTIEQWIAQDLSLSR